MDQMYMLSGNPDNFRLFCKTRMGLYYQHYYLPDILIIGKTVSK